MDTDLVIRAQQGDRIAFEALATRHYARLQKAAIGILRDKHLAEDATQQALLNLWRDLRRLRDPLRFEGWSYRLLVRACYSEAKRRPAWLPEPSVGPIEEPVASDAFDVVIALNVIHHVLEPFAFLDRAAQLTSSHLVLEYPGVSDPKFRRTVEDASPADSAPFIGVSKPVENQSFVFSPSSIERYLIDYRGVRVDQMRFDEQGRVSDFGVAGAELDSVIDAGVAFRTSGCPGGR